MTKEQAISAAKREAKQHGRVMVVVNAPVENAEEESGPYGYCPRAAFPVLFQYGEIEVTIAPV